MQMQLLRIADAVERTNFDFWQMQLRTQATWEKLRNVKLCWAGLKRSFWIGAV